MVQEIVIGCNNILPIRDNRNAWLPGLVRAERIVSVAGFGQAEV